MSRVLSVCVRSGNLTKAYSRKLYLPKMQRIYFVVPFPLKVLVQIESTLVCAVHAEALVKGTNVDGVYDCNSQDNNVTFEHISFRELTARGATAMDMMAITFCEDNGIPVVVFNLLNPGNISRALCGDQVGTLIDQAERV
ncbi:hypothetical protein SAY86_007149 [Trapa natans]|uniref:UMP kinase n=1 Tax=Trapa natans TaxID=22666 RepID=A0AAN7LD09_TRANT|nr:hypothetical protein SAY86_007149 [Trapa natans]